MKFEENKSEDSMSQNAKNEPDLEDPNKKQSFFSKLSFLKKSEASNKKEEQGIIVDEDGNLNYIYQISKTTFQDQVEQMKRHIEAWIEQNPQEDLEDDDMFDDFLDARDEEDGQNNYEQDDGIFGSLKVSQ